MTGPAQLALPFARIVPAHPVDFLAAESNAEARAWLARTGDWPQRRLLVWGPRGSGKSHLLRDWVARQGGRLHAGAALRFHPPDGPIAIDDAHQAPPQPLLHMLNAAAEAGHAVLLSAATPPSRWTLTLADLASRLRAAVAVPLGAPEDELLRALLARLLADRQLRLSEATQLWLLTRLPRTHAAVAEAVDRLDRAALCAATAITPALARAVLPDLLADHEDASDPGVDEDLETQGGVTSLPERGFL